MRRGVRTLDVTGIRPGCHMNPSIPTGKETIIMKRTTRLLGSIAACSALTLAACGSDSDQADDTPATTAGLESASSAAPATSDAPGSTAPDPTTSDTAGATAATTPETTSTDESTDATTTAPAGDGGEAAAALTSALEQQDPDSPLSYELEIGVDSGGVQQSFTGSGQIDPTTKSTSIVLNLPAQGTTPAATLETRVVDGVAYLSGAPLAALGATTPWVSVPADQIAAIEQMAVPGIDTSDPSSFLALPPLEGAQVTDEGSATVAGVEVTNYRVSIDPTAASDSPGAGQLGQVLQDGTLDFLVSVDAEGQLRQLSFDEQLAAPEGTATTAGAPTEVALSYVITVTDYGTPVTIEPPAPDQVTDVSSQVQQAGD